MLKGHRTIVFNSMVIFLPVN